MEVKRTENRIQIALIEHYHPTYSHISITEWSEKIAIGFKCRNNSSWISPIEINLPLFLKYDRRFKDEAEKESVQGLMNQLFSIGLIHNEVKILCDKYIETDSNPLKIPAIQQLIKISIRLYAHRTITETIMMKKQEMKQ